MRYIWFLFSVFFIFKVTGDIDWSWLWVTSPLWISVTVGTFVVILAAFFGED